MPEEVAKSVQYAAQSRKERLTEVAKVLQEYAPFAMVAPEYATCAMVAQEATPSTIVSSKKKKLPRPGTKG
jgi:hypothetical protein